MFSKTPIMAFWLSKLQHYLRILFPEVVPCSNSTMWIPSGRWTSQMATRSLLAFEDIIFAGSSKLQLFPDKQLVRKKWLFRKCFFHLKLKSSRIGISSLRKPGFTSTVSYLLRWQSGYLLRWPLTSGFHWNPLLWGRFDEERFVFLQVRKWLDVCSVS